MLILTIDLIFAAVAFGMARAAFSRGWPFMRSGWQIIDAQVQRTSDPRRDVESRRNISDGGSLLIGGVLHLIGGLVAAGVGLYFSLDAMRLLTS